MSRPIMIAVFTLIITVIVREISARSCTPDNAFAKGTERLSSDEDILLIQIYRRRSNCDNTGGTYTLDVSSGAIGEEQVSMAGVDWTQLSSTNSVTYNQGSTQITFNSVSYSLPIQPFEWDQFYSSSLNMLYVVTRNATRGATNGHAWVYALNVTDSNRTWQRIDIDSATFDYLVNEEWLNNATWTSTLDTFESAPILDDYRVVSLGGYYQYGADTFQFIWEFCCVHFDSRTNRMYESYDYSIKITTFKADGSGDVIDTVTHAYTQQELDTASSYSFIFAFCISFISIIYSN
eukprot:115926_1